MKTFLIILFTMASIYAAETETIIVLTVRKVFVTKTSEYKANSFKDTGDRYVITTDKEQITLNKSEVLQIKETIDETEKVVVKLPHAPQEGISEERKKLVRRAQYLLWQARTLYNKGLVTAASQKLTAQAEEMVPHITEADKIYKEGLLLAKTKNETMIQEKFDKAENICPGIIQLSVSTLLENLEKARISQMKPQDR